jgi:hypothetical protein
LARKFKLATSGSLLVALRDDSLDAASTGTKSGRFSRNGNLMGVMARKSGDNFIITSDRIEGELPSIRAPKKQMTDVYRVWTGIGWSATMTDAKPFAEIDAADEYVRANYALVMG